MSGQVPRRSHRHWFVSAAVGAAVVLCSLSLNGVIDNGAWVPGVLTTVAVVLLAMSIARSLRVPRLLVPFLGLVALMTALTSQFFPTRSTLGFVPNSETLQFLPVLLNHAQSTVMSQVAPVIPSAGILLMTCAGYGFITVLVDTVATSLRKPAASGIGLFLLLVVPAAVLPQSIGLPTFLAAMIGFLLLLGTAHWAEQRRLRGPTGEHAGGQLGRAVAVAAACIAGTVLIPLVIPGFTTGSFPQGAKFNVWGGGTGLNPVVTLGNDLRNPQGSGRITYSTTATEPVYLRSVTLENFGGDRWEPEPRTAGRQEGTERIGGSAVRDLLERTELTVTRISPGSFTSPWLLAPYAPVRVNGLDGAWSWDPSTLSIMSANGGSASQQDYEVLSVDPELTSRQLSSVRPAQRGDVDERFLAVPAGTPDIVRETAERVTGTSRNPYAQAIAIQEFLRGPEFSYSLDAPVEGGYDGNSMDVVAEFLDVRSGYCVHYAGTMAMLARVAGIPSRVAVGYIPGTSTGETSVTASGQELREFTVNSRDAHAWPELYFEGVGWVAFEPTPSRGVVPDYARDEFSAGSSGAPDALDPGDAPRPSETSETAPESGAPGPDQPTEASEPVLSRWALVFVPVAVLLALLPFGLRRWRFRRAIQRIDRGWAIAAWEETRHNALDFGYPTHRSDTPRAFANRIVHDAGLEPQAEAALTRLRTAYEHAEYAHPQSARRHLEDESGVRTSSREDVKTVREALNRTASRAARFKATFWPASLWRD